MKISLIVDRIKIFFKLVLVWCCKNKVIIQAIFSTYAVIHSLPCRVLSSDFIYIPVVIGMYFFFSHELENTSQRDKKLVFMISFVFALCQLCGDAEGSYRKFGTWITLIGWSCIFYRLVHNIFLVSRNKINDWEIGWTKQKVFVGSYLVCMLAWIPYLLMYYPGIATPDTANQFFQFFGLVNLNNHHPIIHTYFMKVCYDIGYSIFNNENAGMAMCSFIQMNIMSAIFSYTLLKMYEIGTNKKYIFACLLFYALMPFNALYSITLWKDIIFGGLTLLLTLVLWDITINKWIFTWKNFISLIVISFLFALFRSNGFYAYLLLIPCIIYFAKGHRFVWIVGIAITVLFIWIEKIPVMRYYNIVQPDLAETLSIPEQQIARVIVEKKEIKVHEKILIGKLFDISQVPVVYKPWISDPIKGLVRKTGDQKYIKENKLEYFKLWLKLGIRYPKIYLKAWRDQTRGYWYPAIQYWINSTGVQNNLKKINIHRHQIIKKYVDIDFYKKYPIVGLFWSIGFYFWVMLLMITLRIREQKGIFVFLPTIAVWASLFLSTPVFAEFRYIYGMIVTVPFFIAISWSGLMFERGKGNAENSNTDTML